ncbi:MAG: hypothetical protein WCO42_05510 [bacterium]
MPAGAEDGGLTGFMTGVALTGLGSGLALAGLTSAFGTLRTDGTKPPLLRNGSGAGLMIRIGGLPVFMSGAFTDS